MSKIIKLSPVLCAALGAAVSYYVFFPLYRSGFISTWVLLLPVAVAAAVLCFFRVAVSLLNSEGLSLAVPGMPVRSLRFISMLIIAFTAGLALGIGSGSKALTRISFGIPENKVSGISGILLDDPRIVSGGRAMATLSLKNSAGPGGVRTSARGEVTVFFPEFSASRLKEFGRGAEVFAEGSLKRRTDTDVFIFTADTLHITKAASAIENFRTGLRLSLTRRFTGSQENAWGGLALALLLGIRDNLDSGFAALYRDAGCSYLLALSGMHLAVLIALISFLLKKPLGLRTAALAGSIVIIAYCFLVGPFPSLTRSVIMYLLGVLAVVGFFKKDPFSLLCMAFLIQLTATPQAGLTVSFMLSYLALAGILILGKLINIIFMGLLPKILRNSLSASLGALIATAGISVWFFGDLRPMGIIAGLVLAPLVTVFMVGALIWLGLSAIFPVISSVIEKPLSFLYWIMEKTAELAAYVPGVSANSYLVLLLSLIITALVVLFGCRRYAEANYLKPFDV